MIEFGNLSVVDYLRSGALIVAFLATACPCSWLCSGREKVSVWLMADHIATVVFGLGLYCFPKILLEYQTDGKLDHMHMFFNQTLGATLLGLSIIMYFIRRSDTSTSVAWALSRCVSSATLFMVLLTSQCKLQGKDQHFTDQNMSFAVLGCGLWFLGNLICLFRHDNFGSSGTDISFKDRFNCHLCLDLLLMFTYFVIDMGLQGLFVATMPELKFDSLHMYQCRAIAAIFLFGIFYGFRALHFEQGADKQAYFYGRLTMLMLLSPLYVYYQWYYDVGKGEATRGRWIWIGLHAVTIVNVIMACVRKTKTD